MATKTLFGIQPRILIMLLFLGIVPMILCFWIIFSHNEALYMEMKGKELADLAEIATLQLRNQLQAASRQMDGLACNPSVLETLAAGNRELQGKEEAALAQIVEQDKTWAGLAPEDPMVRRIVGTPLSAYLTKFIAIHPTFREITVLNRLGAAVASAHIPDHYLYGDSKWRDLVVNNYMQRGAYVSDVKRSEFYKAYILEVIVPVFDSNQSLLGMIRGILKTDYINAIIRPFRFGETGQALLIASDGTIISSRDVDLSNQVTYDFFEPAKPLLGEGQKRAFQVERRTAQARFIGVSRTNLRDAFPDTHWYLLVEQDLQEVQQPISGQKGWAIVTVIIVLVINIILAVWFSREFTKPLLDMHLEKL